MGEQQKNRDAVDSFARRIQKHAQQTGDRKNQSFEQARKRAVEVAKRHDRKQK